MRDRTPPARDLERRHRRNVRRLIAQAIVHETEETTSELERHRQRNLTQTATIMALLSYIELPEADLDGVRDVLCRRMPDLALRPVDRRNQPNWTDETERDYREWVAELYWEQADRERRRGHGD